MSIIIRDRIAYRVITELTPADQAELIRIREAEALDRRDAKAHLTTDQLIQAGEEAEKLLFG